MVEGHGVFWVWIGHGDRKAECLHSSQGTVSGSLQIYDMLDFEI